MDCGKPISHYPTMRCQPCFAASQRGRGRASKEGLEATDRPSTWDIAWAAGIFEGEGSCRYNAGSAGVGVAQKDPWLLYRFQVLFGGSISAPRPNGVRVWNASGARARGFLMTIYSFLSPRRQEQARKTLGIQIPRV